MLNRNELKGLVQLVAENRDSAKLQKKSGISYMESIELKNKLLDMIESIEKEESKKLAESKLCNGTGKRI